MSGAAFTFLPVPNAVRQEKQRAGSACSREHAGFAEKILYLKSNELTMTDETKTNQCPIDPECEIDAKGFHKKYHLAPVAGSKILERARRCAFCGLDVTKCNDRVTMTNAETGEILGTNIMVTNGALPLKREENAKS